jgi:hypothetical protein
MQLGERRQHERTRHGFVRPRAQNKAALRSLFELKGQMTGKTIDLFFGPDAPAGKEGVWIKTIPGKGWFAYFRIYGPEAPAFDGSWKPGDFEVTGVKGSAR